VGACRPRPPAIGPGAGSCHGVRQPKQETPKKARRDWRIVETGRALRRLRDRGIVIYQPARGRGHPSLIGLPAPLEKARTGAPLLDGEKARPDTPLS
jgi:hypothetical protein